MPTAPAFTIEAARPKWLVGRPFVPQFSALSAEYVEVPVSAMVAGAPVDPTGDQVSFAFMLGRTQPAAGDWIAGVWQSSTPLNGQYFAQVLIGPGTTAALAAGDYTVWVKIAAAPETPIKQVGTVTIY